MRGIPPTARIGLGRGLNQMVIVTGVTAAEIGTPLVEIGGGLEYLQHMTPAQADKLAAGLTQAARIARGDEQRPAR